MGGGREGVNGSFVAVHEFFCDGWVPVPVPAQADAMNSGPGGCKDFCVNSQSAGNCCNVKEMDGNDCHKRTDRHSTNELIELYPPLSTHFESNSFNPHLIFINLIIRSVIVVKLIGRGRVESYLLPNTNVDFDKFQKLDHASVIKNLTDALKEIADADYNMVYTEIDEGHIQEAEAEGPDSDGMYLVGSHGDDGEGITASELATAKSELEIYTNSLDDGLYEFRIFFPLRKIQFDNFQADY